MLSAAASKYAVRNPVFFALAGTANQLKEENVDFRCYCFQDLASKEMNRRRAEIMEMEETLWQI